LATTPLTLRGGAGLGRGGWQLDTKTRELAKTAKELGETYTALEKLRLELVSAHVPRPA
jgi:hypothetical protein